MTWSEAQKRYQNSLKGKLARKKYQQSDKARETQKKYREKKKIRLLELKKSNNIKANYSPKTRGVSAEVEKNNGKE